ncbi:MAG: hypothetical protein Q4C03_06070, partial [bacterium]|nr:hypothetical protein [bacterium]
SVTKIGEGAFSGCTAMKEMIFNGPPPNVEPLSAGNKQVLERKGLSNPETLPATKGYYLPEHAEAWENVLGGETGEWNNLQMEPLGGAMLEWGMRKEELISQC